MTAITNPSFSMIIETENLATAELAGLAHCLDSLMAQDLAPTHANEVLILDSGDVPVSVIEQIQHLYPWITIRQIPSGLEYYAAKMEGVALTTGEIIVLCDSDCVYDSNWLSRLLAAFTQDSNIQIVAGETTSPASSPYEIAIALTYIFPRFSRETALAPSSFYFCNNVAFRRNFLLGHPIPSDLPIYRGNCVIHARSLMRQGYQIWRQPNARATHAAPNGRSHFFWRFLLLGYDAIAVARLTHSTHTNALMRIVQDLNLVVGIILWQAKQIIRRLITVFAEDPRRAIALPIALPIALSAWVLFWTGLILGGLNPDCFLNRDRKVEAHWEHS